jgi:hypothetical protein
MRSRMDKGKAARRRGKPTLEALYDELRGNGWEPGKILGWDDEERDHWYGKLLASGTSWKLLPLACVSYELLKHEQPDTVRGNMYQVVSNAPWLLPDTSDKSYDRIQGLLNRLRLNGTIPFK